MVPHPKHLAIVPSDVGVAIAVSVNRPLGSVGSSKRKRQHASPANRSGKREEWDSRNWGEAPAGQKQQRYPQNRADNPAKAGQPKPKRQTRSGCTCKKTELRSRRHNRSHQKMFAMTTPVPEKPFRHYGFDHGMNVSARRAPYCQLCRKILSRRDVRSGG